jgi:hypothetical protein
MTARRVLCLVATCMACSGGDPLTGLVESRGDGPVVVWDVFDTPLPDIPFPNDVATRSDPTSATGRRLNASLLAETFIEADLRRNLARLDGFGTFAPIWVRFESPDPDDPALARIDLERLADLQRLDGNFADDAVLVIDVTPGSRTYGEAVALDFGSGSFPITVETEDFYFDNDPRACASNLLFDTYEEDVDGDGHLDTWEDTNQNGVLDAGEDRDRDGRLDGHEDTDGDGVFDHPNLWSAIGGRLAAYDPCDPNDARDYEDLIPFYELATDTLWFRPVVPLAEGTTYAVVLTRDLVNESGHPVRSPFPWAHHLQQTEALSPLLEDDLLARYGRGRDDIAFAWSFTTQRVADTLIAIREGLHGVGPLSQLSQSYPPEVTEVVPLTVANGSERYLLRPETIGHVV